MLYLLKIFSLPVHCRLYRKSVNGTPNILSHFWILCRKRSQIIPDCRKDNDSLKFKDSLMIVKNWQTFDDFLKARDKLQ